VAAAVAVEEGVVPFRRKLRRASNRGDSTYGGVVKQSPKPASAKKANFPTGESIHEFAVSQRSKDQKVLKQNYKSIALKISKDIIIPENKVPTKTGRRRRKYLLWITHAVITVLEHEVEIPNSIRHSIQRLVVAHIPWMEVTRRGDVSISLLKRLAHNCDFSYAGHRTYYPKILP